MKNRRSRAPNLLFALVVVACATGSREPANLIKGSAAHSGAKAGSDGSSGMSGIGGSSDATGETSSGSDADVGNDAVSIQGDSSQVTDLPLQSCTSEVGSCPARSFAIWQELLNAKDFGGNATLIAMGGQAVLVAIGDGTYRIVCLTDPTGVDAPVPPYSSWEFPATGDQPIAVTEGRVSNLAQPSPKTLLVVTCGPDHTRCSIWRTELSEEGISAWQEIELPSDFSPQDVALDSGNEPQKICVFGNGLYCLDDTWQAEIAPSPDLQINAIVFGTQWSIAVGEHGRWFKRERDNPVDLKTWQEQPPIGDASLTHVSVAGAGGVITGDGRLQAAVGPQADLFNCSPSNDLVAFILDQAASGSAYSVTSSGEIWYHASVTPQRPEPYCVFQQLTLPSAILEATIVPCQDATNPRILTDKLLIGVNVCLRLF